jgi:hypothetical protein
LKDEWPIKPVKDHFSRYADIILFLHEKRPPEQFALNGDEDTQEKAKVANNHINWKANVVKRLFLVEAVLEELPQQPSIVQTDNGVNLVLRLTSFCLLRV